MEEIRGGEPDGRKATGTGEKLCARWHMMQLGVADRSACVVLVPHLGTLCIEIAKCWNVYCLLV